MNHLTGSLHASRRLRGFIYEDPDLDGHAKLRCDHSHRPNRCRYCVSVLSHRYRHCGHESRLGAHSENQEQFNYEGKDSAMGGRIERAVSRCWSPPLAQINILPTRGWPVYTSVAIALRDRSSIERASGKTEPSLARDE